MKILYPCIIILALSSSPAYAQTVTGQLNCKITGSTVEASEEGKYKSYSRVKDGAKAGDDSILKYTVSKDSVYISMERNNDKKDTIINEHFSSSKIDLDYEVKRTKDLGIIIRENEYDFSLSLLPDYIRLKTFSELTMKRYYKNDWHGMFVDYRSNETHVVVLAFNCRHTNDQLDKAYKIFK